MNVSYSKLEPHPVPFESLVLNNFQRLKIKKRKSQLFFLLKIQIAHRAGYININWKKMEKDMDKVAKKVEKQVKKIKKNDKDVEKGIIALANKVKMRIISL